MTRQTEQSVDTAVLHSTFVLERSYPASPERVFAAFADPAKKQRWYADRSSLNVELFEMDFRVGGVDHVHYRTPNDHPLKGALLCYEIGYQDIVPDHRIVLAYTVAVGDQRVSASLVTFEFVPKDGGTDLTLTEQGCFFQNSGGAEMRKIGWSTLLDKLREALAD